jgi:hypothetical protein
LSSRNLDVALIAHAARRRMSYVTREGSTCSRVGKRRGRRGEHLHAWRAPPARVWGRVAPW